ncbi:MAG TPA: DUF4292 domain-containing protein [Flavisolibacter sp.]
MRFFYLIAVIALMASCRSARNIQTAIAKKDTTQVTLPVATDNRKADSIQYMKTLLTQIEAGKIQYTTFSAKMNVDYRGGDGKHYDVNANVRMYRDSAIWISVNAVLGIEAMRVLVTRDSVKLLDKLNKVYTARSVEYLQEVSALPLNLRTLQELLVGNPVFLDTNLVSYSRSAGTVSLLTLGQWFKNLLTISEENRTIQRSKLDDADVTRNRTADLTYEDYENKKGMPFATKRRITVTEKNKLDIKLDFKQYDFNEEVSFPFSVPKNYDRN